MANLLHRLLRGRHGPDAEEQPVAPPAPAAAAPEPAKGSAESGAELPPAKTKPTGRGPRKTRDEVSSIGPGEP